MRFTSLETLAHSRMKRCVSNITYIPLSAFNAHTTLYYTCTLTWDSLTYQSCQLSQLYCESHKYGTSLTGNDVILTDLSFWAGWKLLPSRSHFDTSLFLINRNLLICRCALHHPISTWGADCRYRPQGYETNVMKKWQWRRMYNCAMWFCNAILCNVVL